MAICPLAVDWGNVADWAAVVVGVGAAAATTFVAVLAHGTSKRATEIAEKATEIAAQQHGEAVKLREDTASILGRLMLVEMTVLPGRLAATLKALHAGIEWETAAMGIKSGHALVIALDETALSFVAVAETVEDRIHNLPNALGPDAGTLIGASRSLNDLAKRMRAKVRVTQDPEDLGGKSHVLYAGAFSEFRGLRKQLSWMLNASIQYAGDFQDFVGVERTDYTDLRALIDPEPK